MKIATIGPKGSFGDQWAHSLFKGSTCLTSSVEDAFDLLSQRLVDCAIVPFDETLSGLNYFTLDALKGASFYIDQCCSTLNTDHLVGFVDFAKVQKVYASLDTYERCKRSWYSIWAKHPKRPQVELIYTASDVFSVQKLMQEKTHSCALVSEAFTQFYRLPILHKELGDIANNQTRYVSIWPEKKESSCKKATFILIELGQKPLNALLNPFIHLNVPIVSIHSKQFKEPLFVIEFLGNEQDPIVSKLLEQLESMAKIQILGSY